jgi:KUP system potassium uptake protein
MIGTAMLYGDGVITPAISVLSAVEGLRVATPAFKTYIVPLTVIILIALFAIQPLGSGRVGVAIRPNFGHLVRGYLPVRTRIARADTFDTGCA